MKEAEVRAHRLRNLGLTRATPQRPEEVVAWMGAMQSQDHVPAKWALSKRCKGVDAAAVERAYEEGSILRTHALRPTWHYVTPADIRWILRLTAPRVERANAGAYRQLGLDSDVLDRCNKIVSTAFEGGRHLTRRELGAELQRDGLHTGEPRRLGYIAMHLELRGTICSGIPRGKQHTYALLQERASTARELSHDDALAELTRRYFTSHGPATIKDFGWWSSLTTSDIKRGLEMVGAELDRKEIDGRAYFFAKSRSRATLRSPMIRLLQAYDEYLVGYRETKFVADPERVWAKRDGSSFPAVVTLDGKIIGRWKPTVMRDQVVVEVALQQSLDPTASAALELEAARYGEFVGLPATVKARQ